MHSANYDEIANQPTIVGTSGGPSYYGTYDQSGNVYEWTEGVGPVIDFRGERRPTREARGGRYVGRHGNLGLRADYAHYFPPDLASVACGVRLCSHGLTGEEEGGRTSRNPLADPQRWSQFVLVGDAGNAPDSLEPIVKNGELEQNAASYGAVDQEYLIQRCPVTAAEYCEFLNAVAATSDQHGLYSDGMQRGQHPVLEVYQSPGATSYRPLPGRSQMPMTRISWFAAARLANWLSNGKPRGRQTPQTTEDGAYALEGVEEASVDTRRNAVNPNTGKPPTYWIASADQWHKAAYYKGGGIDSGYWTYATQSDTPPLPITADAAGNGLGTPPVPHHWHDWRDVVGGASNQITLSGIDGRPVMLNFWNGILASVTRG